ncbi:MAG: SLBB domain-containing protein [Candidatus Omnitrophica bacterium]|nr:SLBB domain-containing protein [Candidatus Omnitrophota bacterium]
MSRKTISINLLLSVIFLSTTIFPSTSFSYQKTNYKPDTSARENWTDESTGYEPVIYKKVRCPRCNMEFYYIPGKESPHAHWVNYEVPQYQSKDTASASSSEGDVENKASKKTGAGSFLDLVSDKSNDIQKKIAQVPSETGIMFSGAKNAEFKEYELRLKLSCPYDGYSFFPEGDVIEDRKLLQKALFEEPSVIEASFAKAVSFGFSKELRQFGYDLFMVIGEEEKKDEEDASITGKAGETLSALGMLKNAFMPAQSSPSFSSSQSVAQSSVVPIGPDYAIGPGDNLVINIWGSVQESFPVEVDREGKIMLPKAGPLYLWGLKFREAEKRIKERLNQFYTNFNVDVSMGKLREMQIYVIGEVKRPGSYSINSQATVFQALYIAEGITKLGSLRKIKILHTDNTKEEIDLYPLLIEGESVGYSKIQSGDTIFVPALGDVVAIAGNVKRPGIYETKSDILLSDLLKLAGGITPTGDLQRLQVERIENNERRIMIDIELKKTDMGKFFLEDIKIQNGDLVIVSPIVRLKHDFVSILGNVERPGDYALTKNMKVTDLIARAKGFMPATYISRLEIARVTNDRARQIIPVNLQDIKLGEKGEDIILDEWDILLVYSESEVTPPSFVDIDGAVNRPGKYELTPQMKISDLIFRAGSVKSGEVIRGAELFHIIPGEQPVVRDIGIKQVSDTNIFVDKDIILRSGDAIFVKSEPKLTERRIISLKGEVKYPGTYSIRKGERLSSLVERAGDFTDEAFLDGAMFNRESIKEAQEKIRQQFLAREQRAILEEQQAILLRTSSSGIVTATSDPLKMRQEMIEIIASAEIEGRMVIVLKPLSQLKGTKDDILLEDGDVLKVPQMPSGVAVIGSVNNPTTIPFESGRGIEYYMRKTGGLTKHADKQGIYVIKANGEAVSKFMMSKSVERGATIVVPQEFKYWTPPGQLLKDTVEILSRIAMGVGIIAALQ